MSVTAVLFLGGYAFALLRALAGSPLWGMYAYLATFYLHPPSSWWGASLPSIRWSLVAALVTLLSLLIHGSKLKTDRPSWLANPIAIILGLYVFYAFLQSAWVVSPQHGEGLELLTKYLVLFYVIYRLVDSEEMLRRFLLAHVAGCAYFGYKAFNAASGGRLEGVGGPGVNDANTLGMHLSTGILVGAFLLLSEKGIYRIGILFGLILMINGLILTQSRGALIGLVAGGLVTVILKPPQIRKIYWTLAVLAVFGFLSLAGNTLLDRMQTLMADESKEEEIDNSAKSRIVIANAQFKMFSNHPLGVGFRGTTYLSRNYLDPRWLTGPEPRALYGSRASHSTPMTSLVNGGVVGIMLYLSMAVVVAVTLRNLRQLDKRGLPTTLALYRAGIGGALISAFVAGQTSDYTKAEVHIWLLVTLVTLTQLSHRAVLSGERTAQVERPKKRPGRFRVA